MHARALSKGGAGAVGPLFGLQPVHEIEHGEEACAAAMLDELAGDGHREMRLAGSCQANNILLIHTLQKSRFSTGFTRYTVPV